VVFTCRSDSPVDDGGYYLLLPPSTIGAFLFTRVIKKPPPMPLASSLIGVIPARVEQKLWVGTQLYFGA